MEDPIRDIEDGVVEDTQLEQQQEQGIQENEDILRSPWDNI